LLIEANYDSTKFIKAVGDISIDYLHLDAHETAFFRRVLQDSGRIRLWSSFDPKSSPNTHNGLRIAR